MTAALPLIAAFTAHMHLALLSNTTAASSSTGLLQSIGCTCQLYQEALLWLCYAFSAYVRAYQLWLHIGMTQLLHVPQEPPCSYIAMLVSLHYRSAETSVTFSAKISLQAVMSLLQSSQSKDKTLKEISGGYHELLMGPEKEDVISLVKDWMLSHSGTSSAKM